MTSKVVKKAFRFARSITLIKIGLPSGFARAGRLTNRTGNASGSKKLFPRLSGSACVGFIFKTCEICPLFAKNSIDRKSVSGAKI